MNKRNLTFTVFLCLLPSKKGKQKCRVKDISPLLFTGKPADSIRLSVLPTGPEPSSRYLWTCSSGDGRFNNSPVDLAGLKDPGSLHRTGTVAFLLQCLDSRPSGLHRTTFPMEGGLSSAGYHSGQPTVSRLPSPSHDNT